MRRGEVPAALLDALEPDRPSDVARAALVGLARLGPGAFEPARSIVLRSMVVRPKGPRASPPWVVRDIIEDVLPRTGPAGRSFLVELTRSGAWRTEAIRGLSRLDEHDAADPRRLEELTADPDPATRLAAAAALYALTGDAARLLAVVAPLLDDPRGVELEGALAIVAQLGVDAAPLRPRLEAARARSDPRQRAAIEAALRALDGGR